MTIGFFVLSRVLNLGWTFGVYLSCFILYLALKFLLHRRVIRDLKCRFAIPMSFFPFSFFVLEEVGAEVKTYEYNARNQVSKDEKRRLLPLPEILNLARTSPVFQDVSRIMKYFFVTDVRKDANGTTIIARDLAVRNFGGKFGETVLKFDREGKLIHEVANL